MCLTVLVLTLGLLTDGILVHNLMMTLMYLYTTALKTALTRTVEFVQFMVQEIVTCNMIKHAVNLILKHRFPSLLYKVVNWDICFNSEFENSAIIVETFLRATDRHLGKGSSFFPFLVDLFFSFKVDHFSEGTLCLVKQTGRHKSFLPCKNDGTDETN